LHKVEGKQDRKSRLYGNWGWFFTTAHSENIGVPTVYQLAFPWTRQQLTRATTNLATFWSTVRHELGQMGDIFVQD